MRFGIFSVVDHYPTELARSTRQFYEELLQQCQLAENLGFDSFWVAEHHFHEYGVIPKPAVWMAAASQRTKRIRLGSAVVVLPFDNPLRVAEDYAMVDVLSNGRVCLGVGSGYLKHEFDGFGIDPEEKRARFDESLDVLRRAWSGERFSYNGRFCQVADLALNVVPIQRPSPALYIAVLRSEAAQYVGRMQMPLLSIPYASCEDMSEMGQIVASYKSNYVSSGGSAKDAVSAFALHTFCAETRQKACDMASSAMDRYVRTRLYAKQRPMDLLQERDLIAIGDPDDIRRVLRKYEEAGLDEFLAIVNFGGMPHEAVMESMSALAQHVLPQMSSV